MRLDSLQHLNDARSKRIAAALLIDLSTGNERVLLEGDAFFGELGGSAVNAFRSGRSMLFETEKNNSFLNVYLPAPRIVIIGAVHIGQFLTQMAMFAGFDVHIVDPRMAFATAERFPGAKLSVDWPIDHFMADPLDRFTALVALSHDPKIDDIPIAEALRTACFYVGALGSRKTHASRTARLMKEGFDVQTLSAIHAPIGLDIGATNPAEIAVAILAQIVQALHSPAPTVSVEK